MSPVLLPLVLACAAGAGDTGGGVACDDSGPTVTWENWTDGFFATWCRSCHSADSPNRAGAPEGVDFDTEQETRDQADRVRARVLERGDMPVGGGVYDEDLELLERWLDCG